MVVGGGAPYLASLAGKRGEGSGMTDRQHQRGLTMLDADGDEDGEDDGVMTKWRRENGWVAVRAGAGWGRVALRNRRHGVSTGFPQQLGLP